MVADDCPTEQGVLLEAKVGKAKPIHLIQYELMTGFPYKYTQEDILFLVHAQRQGISENNETERTVFFEKSRPCLRSSALGKKYGWGVHFDAEGKTAIYARESKAYQQFAQSDELNILKAMRNKRAK